MNYYLYYSPKDAHIYLSDLDFHSSAALAIFTCLFVCHSLHSASGVCFGRHAPSFKAIPFKPVT